MCSLEERNKEAPICKGSKGARSNTKASGSVKVSSTPPGKKNRAKPAPEGALAKAKRNVPVRRVVAPALKKIATAVAARKAKGKKMAEN